MKLSFFFLFISSCINLQATICNISLFENSDGGYLFLLSDWHRDDQLGSKSKKQQDDIIYFAKKLDAHLIAEDMSDYTGDNIEVKEYWDTWATDVEYMKKNGLLWPESLEVENNIQLYVDYLLPNIIRRCQKQKISCFNAECRHVSTVSNSKNNKIAIAKVVEDYNKMLQSLRDEFLRHKNSYPQDIVFFNVCLRDIAEVESGNTHLMEYLKQVRHKTLYDITDKRRIINPDGIYYDILYDLRLVDFNILMNVHKNRHKKFIFVCAGATHIENILPVIRMMRYKEIFFTDWPKSLHNSAASQMINNGPNIEHYFKQAYQVLRICSVCHLQLPNKECYEQHERLCIRKQYIKKGLLYSGSLGLLYWAYKRFPIGLS